jgi:Flp pilus assembly protein TadG
MNKRSSYLIRHVGSAHASGNAAVEFAILLILLLMILGGLIEFGRVFWYFDTLTKATRDAARLMSIADKKFIASKSVPASGDLIIAAATQAHLPDASKATIKIRCPITNLGPPASLVDAACVDDSLPDNVSVSVEYEVDIGSWIPILMPQDGKLLVRRTLNPHTTMRYMVMN